MQGASNYMPNNYLKIRLLGINAGLYKEKNGEEFAKALSERHPVPLGFSVSIESTIVLSGHYLHGLSLQFTNDFAGRLPARTFMNA